MPDNESSLVFSISEESLESAGFTKTGKARFKDTASELLMDLFEKSKGIADVNGSKGFPREVTHEHVRFAAAGVLQNYHRRPSAPWWAILCQVLEYVASAGVGLGTGQLSKMWGVPTAWDASFLEYFS